MAVGGDQVESVDAAQLRYFLESEALEGRLVLQGMQGDPFEQVAEGEVEIFGQSLQHLEQALLETYAGLDSFDFARRRLWNDFLGGHGGFRVRCLAQSSQVCGGVASMVPWYHCTNRETPPCLHIRVPAAAAFTWTRRARESSHCSRPGASESGYPAGILYC